MKLLRLKINNSFRSLPAGFKIEFRKPDNEFEINLHEPICLVGINGSGKSNVLEALAEIFSYLDQTFLRYVQEHSDSPFVNSFELEYMLPFTFDKAFIKMDSALTFDTKYIHIKITKENDTKPQFYWLLDGVANPITENIVSALPNRVIGYSSGQNELLSIPFYRVRFRYYNTLLEEQKATYRDAIEYSRLRYIDYDENASIILANYLMAKDNETNIFQETLLIADIFDFELTINLNQKKRNILKIDKEIQKLLQFLRDSASTITELVPGVDKLNFIITQQLKKEFQDNFLDASGLYTFFKRLGYLNLNSIKKSKINFLLTAQEEIYENYRIVDFGPEKELFQITAINIKKEDIQYPISYRNLSDGEHQFIQIIGTLMMMKEENALFLFDEPETHFNPRWKYEYTEMFKKVTSEQKSQIILTTHDPVLISGLAKENVIVFNKPQVGVERTYKPEKDLRGMGVEGILLSDIFGFDSTIDIQTKIDLVRLRELQIKRTYDELNEPENIEYSELYEKLRGVDYAEPLNDPMYRDFLLAKETLGVYSKPFLTKEEEMQREVVAIKILEKIKEKYNQ